MKYSIHKIAKILDAIASDLNDADISILLTDSRQVFYPAETLFFALSTKNNDGHKYINELYELGVRNFVVSQILPDWENYNDANFLVVTNTLAALQRIAAYHRSSIFLLLV